MSTESLLGKGSVARGFSNIRTSPWPFRRSSDLFELAYGKALVESSRRPGSVPVYGTNGQTGTHDTALFKGPGVIIGRKGMGHLGVHWSEDDFWVIDTAYSLVPSPDVDLQYAYYLVKFVGLDHLKHGTSNPSLTREVFGAQYFPVPPISTQRAIAEVLGALDEKIAANTTLTTVAEGLLNALATRVLSSAEESRPLDSFVWVTKGVSYRRIDLAEDSQTAMVTLKSITRDGRYSTAGLKGFSGDAKAAQYLSAGDLVVAQTDLTQAADVVGRAVRVPASSRHKELVASLDLAIVRPRGNVPAEYLLAILRSDEFRQHCRDRTSGTTVLHLGRGAIESFGAPWVESDVQKRFSESVQPLHELMATKERESEALVQVRDALLPQLMSGKIRVKDAKRVVEGVV